MYGNLKATFSQCSKWKEKFYDKVCGLPISVGQPYHEGDKFDATISLVNKYFSNCVILLCDSLQRYTMMIYGGYDEDEACQNAILEGDLWLERNRDKYRKLTIPLEIYRWDKWYKSKDYPVYHDIVEKL